MIGYSSGHVDVYNLQSGLHRGSYGDPGNCHKLLETSLLFWVFFYQLDAYIDEVREIMMSVDIINKGAVWLDIKVSD